jgi:hypothetical protein
MRGEDMEFGRRLIDAGERLRYEPSAVVYHPVPEGRMKKQYFLAWWFDHGRARIRAFGVRPGTKWYWGGIPLYMFRNLAVWTLRWMVAIKPRWRFQCRISVSNATTSRSRQRDSAMPKRNAGRRGVLNLRAGEWIEVRRGEEIRSRLDQDGRLETLPFHAGDPPILRPENAGSQARGQDLPRHYWLEHPVTAALAALCGTVLNPKDTIETLLKRTDDKAGQIATEVVAANRLSLPTRRRD